MTSRDQRDRAPLRRQDALEPAGGVEPAEPAAGDHDVPGHGRRYLARGAATRRAAASAGRIAPVDAARSRHGAPANAWFATVAKPSSSVRSASSRWAIRSEGGSSGSVVAHAEAVHAAAAVGHEQRARLAHEPDAEPAALERQPGRALELALLVAEQVAEQALRHRLGALVARAPFGRSTFAPRNGVELGDDPRVRQAGDRHRGRQRLEREQRPPRPA